MLHIVEIVTVRGLDVFGQATSTKKQYDCQCPNCHRSLAASRFAPHLEKCMGMGGNVTRVARRRYIIIYIVCGNEIMFPVYNSHVIEFSV